MSLKSHEVANPKSCLNRAVDDEPIFVLRANDPVAPLTVKHWANAYVLDKQENSTDGVLTKVQLAKVQEARALAYQMSAWRQRYPNGHAHNTFTVLELAQRRGDFWKGVSLLLVVAVVAGAAAGYLWA